MSDPATPVAAPAPSPLEVAFDNLGKELGFDVLADLKTQLTNAKTNIGASPTALTVAAQGQLLVAALTLSLPSLETQAISQGNTTLGALIDLIPSAPLPATPAP